MSLVVRVRVIYEKKRRSHLNPRTIMACSKAVTDFERVGDEASKIA